MNRRNFLKSATLSAAALSAAAMGAAAGQAFAAALARRQAPRIRPFELDEASLAELGQSLAQGRRTSMSLTRAYLRRIQEIDRRGPRVNAVLELNPDAEAIARQMDQEIARTGPRGPLHGVPVLIKDNIDTHDRMTTTAGSLALEGSIAARDAHLVTRLREAGAVILGKSNLSEWANFRGHRSSSGWSARGGQTNNPYCLDRNPSGSSSGSAAAVAANLCAVAVGTETDGSIISPSACCGIVGVKPTVGLVSRSGIIPIAHSQDTAGPMARTVRDAAILLGVLAGRDPADAATRDCPDSSVGMDYTRFLDADGLRGARLGVARKFIRDSVEKPVIEAALAALRAAGATLVDPVDVSAGGGFGDAEYQILLYEFKVDLNAYLRTLGPSARVHSLAELIEFNEKNKDRELIHFGQETLIKAESRGPLTDSKYLEAVAKARRLSRDEGIDAAIKTHRLDAIVAPAGGPAGKTDWIYGEGDAGGSSSPAAVAGYPNITVPAGFVRGLPVGLSFFGGAYTEPALLKYAYAFEQATRHRRPPQFLFTTD